jgi:GNAT superfamily N-acetyltransferase
MARLGVGNAIVMQVVPFSDEHQAGVIDVILPIQQSEFGISITLGDQPDLRDIPGFYQRGSGNFWVALAGAQVVGTIGLLDIGHAQGALRKMFVRAEYRGPTHQVARRLLETLLGWCREKQIREVFLGTTAKFLAAHRFYEKWGFAEIPKTDLPAAFPVMSVDTKFYVHIIPTGDARPPDSADAPQTVRG